MNKADFGTIRKLNFCRTRAMLQHSKASERANVKTYHVRIKLMFDDISDDKNKEQNLGGGGGGGGHNTTLNIKYSK